MIPKKLAVQRKDTDGLYGLYDGTKFMGGSYDEDFLVEIVHRYNDYAEQQKLIEHLINSIQNIPTGEYSEALHEGCNSSGAWDCFREALDKWRDATLAAATKTIMETKKGKRQKRLEMILDEKECRCVLCTAHFIVKLKTI
jgi:hypothetical protein